jgi:hypothetical protein
LQEVVLDAPDGARLDRLGQVRVEAAQAALEPGDVGLDLPPEGAGRLGEPVPLGREHLHELAAPGHQGRQGLRGRIGQRPGGGAHRGREVGQHGRIQGIRLREEARGLREVPDLPGVHHGDGEPRRGQRPDEGPLQAARGLEDDKRGAEGGQAMHEPGDLPLRVRDGPARGGRVHSDVQRGFGDIDANVQGLGCHAVLLLGARPCTMRAWGPWRLSGLCRVGT